IVMGWKTRPLSNERDALDTVFVKLTAAPKPIQLDGLPENVVPIVHHTQDIQCKMPNDKTITISRDQVSLLPNFAMTDFNSQGRTRPFNVCDLQNCGSHQSMYTCLSRGSSFDGTLIVQGFDSRKLTQGVSGHLRQ
ncbi:hypothetical protein K474DRAFT_1559656, partial [Panus rudis PR-1116 ss-1]